MSQRIGPITDLTEVETTYLNLVRRHGVPGPTTKRLEIQPPVADDGESDCWTHAWTVARNLGATYVEGVCRRAGAGGPSMHAWVQQDTPFGPVLIETTPGYEDATHYRGIAIDTTPGGQVDQITRQWRLRSSVLQSALAGAQSAGVPPERVLATVRA